MKTRISLAALLPLAFSVAIAQMPSSFDASGRSTQAQSGVRNDDPAHQGEQPNPQLLGMEIPLLDPASDTMSYNGSKFDVGNNALVRERFEKYLEQTPDDTEEAQRYRKRMNEILKYTQSSNKSKSPVGSSKLVKIGFGLYEIAEYPADGGQANALASAIASALDAQRVNYKRDQDSARLAKDIDRLKKQTNTLTNRNTMRREPPKQNRGPARASGKVEANTFKIATNTTDIAEKKAEQVKNSAANEVTLAGAKLTYQSLLMGMLMQRRFDHVVIGARTYRHIFRDGDTKLNLDKDSDAAKLFSGISGMPPTITAMDSLASNARRDVDQHIEAVYSLLARNKLADATQHLIAAVALGEYMQSVTTFPTKDRLRISEYWNLRKRALTALNARDYGQVEEIADKMKAMDSDFDDSMLRSYCDGKKMQSDLCLRNAMKALRAGNEEEFNKQIADAGIIWPRNPKLKEGAEALEKLDSQDPVKDEFRELVKNKEFRRVHDNQDRYKVVALDPELGKQFEDVLTLVKTIDAMLVQLEKAAERDDVMGPCIAYETLLEQRDKDERYADDDRFRDAVHAYETRAHDFVMALREAESCEQRREYGSALSGYYRAQCICPTSKLAEAGAQRMTDMILKASF